MTLLRRTMAFLRHRWQHTPAQVHLSLPPLTVTPLRHHRHLSSPEWTVRMASSPSFHLTALSRLPALHIRTLSDTFVAVRHIRAHTMERWTFRRWIPMLFASKWRCRCKFTRSTMVAWFLIQHSHLRQLRFQGLNTIPGRSSRRAMCLVGDVVAYQTRRRVCVRALVINLCRSHPSFALVADYAAMGVLRTCLPGQRFVRPHVSRVRNLGIRALSCRQVKKLPENPRWTSTILCRAVMHPGPHIGIIAQMTRTKRMETMENGSMRI